MFRGRLISADLPLNDDSQRVAKRGKILLLGQATTPPHRPRKLVHQDEVCMIITPNEVFGNTCQY